MANFTKTNAKPDNCTLAFTLPIACQICLGKVKQPVVCPNQHVFCHGCMNVWLQRNQKCPACRVTISEENPCRPIIGGVNIQSENEQTFSSRELRRARTEILFKEYENEIERLENEMVACRRDNERLRQQVQDQLETRSCDLNGSRKAPSGGQEAAMLAMLTTKLHEATAQSEKVKTELKKLKQGSSTLAEENENLRRENQRLRLELTGRSPRKFSRYTVATLESKIESYEKEARQLQKALERSDSYIEELQRELAQAKNSQTLCVKDQGMSPASKGVSIRTTRHHDLDQTNDTLGMSLMSPQKPNADGRGQNTCMDESSFRLEMPSPVSPDLVKQCFGDREEESRSCKKRLEFTLNGRRTSGEPIMNKLSKLDTADISDLTIGSPVVDRGRPRATKRDLFAAPSCDSTMDTLDPTMNESDLCLNSDLSDCMKLLDAAEKNVEQRRSSDVFSQSTNGRQSLWR